MRKTVPETSSPRGTCQLPTPRLVESGPGRYRLAGEQARRLMEILGSRSEDDFRLWTWYCYHYDFNRIEDMAFQKASERRQSEIRDAVRAFQHWLSSSYGEVGDDED